MKDYFRKLEKASTIRFIIVLALIAFFSKIPMGMIGAMIIEIFGLDNPLYSSSLQTPTLTAGDIFLAIVIAPILETLIAQMAPIELLSKFTKNTKVLIISSATVFMLFHYPVIEFFPSAFVVGLVLAWAWIVKRPLGLGKTFLIVTLIHSLHNAIVGAFAALIL